MRGTRPKLPEAVDQFRAIFVDSDDDDDVQQQRAVAAATRADAIANRKSVEVSLESNSKSGNTETVTSNASPALTGLSNTAEQTAELLSDATSRRAQAQLSLSQTPIATGCSMAAATSAKTRPMTLKRLLERLFQSNRIARKCFSGANGPHSNSFIGDRYYAAVNCCC